MPIIIKRENGKIKESKINYNDKDIKPLNYPINDLQSVFVHWDNNLKKNVPTENI